MQKIEILRIESLSRAPLVVEGYLFKGTNEKAPKIAIVGAMEGDSILPLYCASSLVDFFKNKIKPRLNKKIREQKLPLLFLSTFKLTLNPLMDFPS